MKASLRLASSIILALYCALLPAQDAPDSAVSLTIRFANGTSQFHVGEIIPLELAFSASVPRTFEMNTRSYDRSGRLDLEQFHVTPAGRDPLFNYFVGGVNHLFMGGGLFNVVYLTKKPQVMTEDLNEWVATDQPGHYRIFVTSGRVGRSGQSDAHPIALQSNTLEFDVVNADPDWQQRTLAAAVATLDRADSTKDEKSAAIRTLRFLDSPESVRELARRITRPGGECNWDCTAGLLGSNRQRLLLQELESLLAAPEAAITSDYMSLLVQTRFMLEHGPMPPSPDDKKEEEEWEALEKKRTEEYDALQGSLLARAAGLLQTKAGAARAETVRTLLLASNSGAKPVELHDSDLQQSLLTLPAEEQSHLLQYSWLKLKAPGMGDVLEKILDQAKINDSSLRGLALLRLDELDHERAVARLTEEIRHPHADNGIANHLKGVLEILPDKPDAQFDELLATRLERKDSPTLDLDAGLIARFATGAILPRVKTFYQSSGDDSCGTKSELVSYFLRVDTDYGIRLLKGADLFCMKGALETAARLKRWSAVEPWVIAELNGPNLWSARNAAEALAEYGSIKAKQSMLERLRKFHQQWAKREKEFQSTPGMPRAVNDAMGFQYGLVEAIGTAQGWLLDDSEIAEVQHLTLGNQKQQVADWKQAHSESIGIDLSFLSFDSFSILIDRYSVSDIDSLRAKLTQFPAGTRFVIFHFHSAQEDMRWNKIIGAIHETAQEHGFPVEMGVSW